MTEQNSIRRIASNDVLVDGNRLGRYVVELVGDTVVDYRPLVGELPFTEWFCEPINFITDTSGNLRVSK